MLGRGIRVQRLIPEPRWEAQPHTSVSFSVPDDWDSGRIWVRALGNVRVSRLRMNISRLGSGATSVTVARVRLACLVHAAEGWSAPPRYVSHAYSHPNPSLRPRPKGDTPASLAEWTLSAGGQDYYDGT